MSRIPPKGVHPRKQFGFRIASPPFVASGAAGDENARQEMKNVAHRKRNPIEGEMDGRISIPELVLRLHLPL
jgi:hypothetical protein